MNLHNNQIPADFPTQPWRKLFKTKSEMDPSPLKFPISRFLPEGVTFIGGLPEAAKTLFCLSMAKGICTGENVLGIKAFTVPEPASVLYLTPEVGERSFRARLDSMRIPGDERFLCRTLTDGPLRLTDPRLPEAVRALKPVVFLDTAVRFNPSDNENDASQSANLLAEAVFSLLREGAKAVVCVHHSAKGSTGEPTLENSLRGSGDLGAMADAVYRLRCEDRASLRVRIQNVKARDFDAVPPFVIEGKPFINDTGNFRVIDTLEQQARQPDEDKERRFLKAIADKPDSTFTELEEVLQMKRKAIQLLADKLGWSKQGGATWIRSESRSS